MARRRSAAEGRGTADVEAYLAALDHPHKAAIALLRRTILDVDPRIAEEVKWNAPSFRLVEHFATFRLHPPPRIQLVLHTGAKSATETRAFTLDVPPGLAKWAAPDRCVLTFVSDADARAMQGVLASAIQDWLAQL